MQISVHKRQQIECSGHNRLYHHSHYIPFWSLGKTELWRWKFHTVNVLGSKIFTNEGAHSKSWFKSGEPESHGWILSTNMSVQGFDCGPEPRNRYYKEDVVVEINENYCAHTRGDLPWKSRWPIRAAECFRPLHKLKGVELVRKIETGLERGRWLSRKLRNTVLMLSMRKGDPPEIVVADSRGGMFSVFA